MIFIQLLQSSSDLIHFHYLPITNSTTIFKVLLVTMCRKRYYTFPSNPCKKCFIEEGQLTPGLHDLVSLMAKIKDPRFNDLCPGFELRDLLGPLQQYSRCSTAHQRHGLCGTATICQQYGDPTCSDLYMYSNAAPCPFAVLDDKWGSQAGKRKWEVERAGRLATFQMQQLARDSDFAKGHPSAPS